MTYSPEQNQKVLRYLLSFLVPEFENTDKLKVQSCLTEMLEVNIDMWRISKELEPYKKDVIPVLVEAMDPRLDQVFMSSNAGTALEIIGDYQAIPPILDNFDRLFEYGSLTHLLKKIAARENAKTTNLIADRLITYLVTERKISPLWEGKYDRDMWDIIDTLIELNALSDQRLPLILERCVQKFSYNTKTFQVALLALSKIDMKSAVLSLENQMKLSKGDPLSDFRTRTRVVATDSDKQSEQSLFTICVRDRNESEVNEMPYGFRYSKPLVHFLEDGNETRQFLRLAGQAEKQESAIDVALNYLEIWLSEIKVPDTRYQECNKLLRENLDLERWEFRQSFILPRKFPMLIYDSQWCRVKFSFDHGDRYDDRTHLGVSYGRLHAPSEDEFMIWNEEKCWCWHRVDYALNFLDGLSPEDAIAVEYRPQVIEQYRNSDHAKSLSAARWTVEMHSAIWKHYGKALFELFDLRRPELWEQYTHFIQEFHELKKSKSYGYPPRDKIC